MYTVPYRIRTSANDAELIYVGSDFCSKCHHYRYLYPSLIPDRVATIRDKELEELLEKGSIKAVHSVPLEYQN